MQVEIARHALDRVPLSIIFDDSTVLVNLNYFFMRDYNLEAPGNPHLDSSRRHRWEDVPVVHPESFTREFAEYCLSTGCAASSAWYPVRRGWAGSIGDCRCSAGRSSKAGWTCVAS